MVVFLAMLLVVFDVVINTKLVVGVVAVLVMVLVVLVVSIRGCTYIMSYWF